MLIAILMYSSETMFWKEERSRVRAVQMDNLRGFLGIRRMDRVPNTGIRELCKVKKGLNERIDEGIFWWFGHVKRDRLIKRVYVGKCASNHSIDRSQKRRERERE